MNHIIWYIQNTLVQNLALDHSQDQGLFRTQNLVLTLKRYIQNEIKN
ncbi:unnamed protein product [Pylaiella littoralis]